MSEIPRSQSINLEEFYGIIRGGINPLSYRRSNTELRDCIGEDLMQSDEVNFREITITFKQKFRDTLFNDEIEFMIYELFAHMIKNRDVKTLLLVTEYGENEKMHLHGYILLSHHTHKEYSDMQNALNRKYGRCTVRMIRHPCSYAKYLQKEQTEEGYHFYYRMLSHSP